jgi:hypothetical protein
MGWYINHDYIVVAYRKNKKSGSHDDFVNFFVGSHHFQITTIFGCIRFRISWILLYHC